MAVIGKIREKSSWVIGLIGLAMLGFIATDLLSNRLFRGSGGPRGVGKVYGKYLDYEEFNNKFQTQRNNYARQNKDQEMSQSTINMINDQAWSEFVDQKVLAKEADILGLEVSGEEIYDMVLGNYPDQIAVQNLGDPKTHKIDRRIKNFMDNIESAKPEQQEQWSTLEDYMANERLKDKYRTLVRAGTYITDLEMQDDYVAKNKTASIQFVPLFLNTVPDSTVQISDDEVKDYYEKHKEDYKREDSRSFDYVTFDVRPTHEDTMNTEKILLTLKNAFANTKDDSSFVTTNGSGTYSNKFEPRGNLGDKNTYLGKREDSIFTQMKPGEFIGPWLENGVWKLAKLVDKKDDSVWYMHASHILIKPSEGPDKKADSLEAVEKAKKILEEVKKPGTDFATVANLKSEDPGNSGRGGDLGWFKEGAMVKPFNDAVKAHSKGDIFMVSSQFGTHVIKVTDNKSKTVVKVAVLEKQVQVGPETSKKANAAATAFRNAAYDAASFDAQVKAKNLTKRVGDKIKPNQHDLPGLENAKELIKWAYNDDTKIGDVSDPKPIGDKIVVAKLTTIFKEGYAPFDDIKKEVKVLAQHEKKKDQLAEKLKKALEKSKDLTVIASEVQSSVNSADGITFQNPNIQNLANEPEVAGTVAGLKLNEVSQPIKGQNGVFIVKLTNVNEIKPPTNYDKERKMMIDQRRNQADGEAKEALKKQADVKDLRYMYY